jgi:hypothetical protein
MQTEAITGNGLPANLDQIEGLLDRLVDIRTVDALVGGGEEAAPIREAYFADAVRLSRRLAGRKASEAEKLVARTIASNWLTWNLLNRRYLVAIECQPYSSSQMLNHLQTASTRAYARVTRGIRCLCAIRKVDIKLNLVKLTLQSPGDT